MVLADIVPTVIQIDWQNASIIGGGIGGALIAAAKMIVEQLKSNSSSTNKRHEDNRADAIEARKENRDLSGAILNIQSQTVKTLQEVQAEIRAVLTRLGQCEVGSKQHNLPKPK